MYRFAHLLFDRASDFFNMPAISKLADMAVRQELLKEGPQAFFFYVRKIQRTETRSIKTETATRALAYFMLLADAKRKNLRVSSGVLAAGRFFAKRACF